MRGLAEYGNDTMALDQINGILSLLSLFGAHFILRSFTLVSDLETTLAETFQKMASEYFLEMNHQNLVPSNDSKVSDNTGFIILGKSEADVFEVINTKPKLVVAIYKVKENDTALPEFLKNLVLPPRVPFFVVLLLEDSKSGNFSDTSKEKITAKCFRLYRPVSNLPLRTFLMMLYGGEGPKWFWATEDMDWNFFRKETRDMKGLTITIALATPLDKELSIARFWANKNSFFWRAMSEHLRFRPVVHFQPLPPQLLKSPTNVYLSLLKTVADGLAVLPVIPSERDNKVEFILTGCDSKYHLMVRTPEYVHSWQSILKPFTLKWWICTGIAILLITTILRIVSHHQNSLSLSGSFLKVFGFVCCQGSSDIPRAWSARLVCYTALIFSLLLYQFYTSNLCSLLSTKKARLPFTSLEHFLAMRTHNLYIHPDTAIYAQIMKAKNGTLKRLWDEFLSKDPTHKLKSETRAKALSKVCKGKGAILGLPFQTIYFRELQCKLVPVNSGYFPANVVTVVRKNFPFKSQFKFVHLRLLESGLSHKFRDDFLNFEKQRETMAKVTNEPVSWEHVVFLFGFYAAFVITSLMMLIMEILVSKVNLYGSKRRAEHSNDEGHRNNCDLPTYLANIE